MSSIKLGNNKRLLFSAPRGELACTLQIHLAWYDIAGSQQALQLHATLIWTPGQRSPDEESNPVIILVSVPKTT